jgi:hypothetical protein
MVISRDLAWVCMTVPLVKSCHAFKAVKRAQACGDPGNVPKNCGNNMANDL